MKHSAFLLCAFLLMTTFSNVIGQASEKESFPDSWKGKWQGKLEIFTPQGVTQSIPMEIHISDHDSAGCWNWQITYKAEKADVRAYELVLVDEEKGHYQIDEKNSILLDAYLFGNVLSSRFSVDGSLLLVNYKMNEARDELSFELFWGKMDPKETGPEIEENTIHSYPLNTRQRAVLRNIL